MLFNTAQYLIFLPIVVLIYYVLPGRMRYIWLVVASCYFYMQWNPVYILLLLICAVVTYFGGWIIENQRKKRGILSRVNPRICLVGCIVINLFILGFYKYFDFMLNCMNMILPHFHLAPINKGFDILLPVGISFYTLQALGYLVDIYRGGGGMSNETF